MGSRTPYTERLLLHRVRKKAVPARREDRHRCRHPDFHRALHRGGLSLREAKEEAEGRCEDRAAGRGCFPAYELRDVRLPEYAGGSVNSHGGLGEGGSARSVHDEERVVDGTGGR
jgi:hypothetical protein